MCDGSEVGCVHVFVCQREFLDFFVDDVPVGCFCLGDGEGCGSVGSDVEFFACCGSVGSCRDCVYDLVFRVDGCSVDAVDLVVAFDGEYGSVELMVVGFIDFRDLYAAGRCFIGAGYFGCCSDVDMYGD